MLTVGTASPYLVIIHGRPRSLATARKEHLKGGSKLQVLSGHRLGEASRTQCNSHHTSGAQCGDCRAQVVQHIGDMRRSSVIIASLRDAYSWRAPPNTTLRLSACMVLIAPVGASHASGMVPKPSYPLLICLKLFFYRH